MSGMKVASFISNLPMEDTLFFNLLIKIKLKALQGENTWRNVKDTCMRTHAKNQMLPLSLETCSLSLIILPT